MKRIIFLGMLSFPFVSAFADGDAVVIALRGEAHIAGAKPKPLHLQDKVAAGSSVTTGNASFVRLAFADNAIVNIGSMTEMKVQPANSGKVSTLEVVTGEIRAKVNRDVIQKAAASGGEDLKMIVKTHSSAIGVRGTDFQVIYNPALNVTALVTFEGHVSMAKLDAGVAPSAAIHSKAAVLVGPGQFSSVTPASPAASPPVKLSPAQFNLLKSNQNMNREAPASTTQAQATISVVPPGADPKALASTGAGLSAIGLAATASAGSPPAAPAPDKNAPRSGGFVDLASGVYVPPPAGSAYDANAGVFVPPANAGTVNPATGAYQPPAGLVLSASTGQFQALASAPGISNSAASSSAAMVAVLNQAVATPSATASISLNTSFVASSASSLPPVITASLSQAAPATTASTSTTTTTTTDSTSNTTCLTCHDTNVQSTKTSVGFQLTIQ